MSGTAAESRDVTILELLDRLVDRGVVLAGDITISVADVDLIFLGLKVLLTSVERAERLRWGLDVPMQNGAIDG
ncbi:MAG: gas vesicle protein [Chloroflexota bacterium]|nr:MAG: gas vesicle protein [Chloroflexota bacterium]